MTKIDMKGKYLATIDPLYGHIYVSDLECELLKSFSFIRLKRIKQLSFAQSVYPSANHTRYEHSIYVIFS